MLRRETIAKKGGFEFLLGNILERARKFQLIEEKPEAIVDATGLESRYVSRYYVWRKGDKRRAYLRWPKLSALCHSGSHLFAGAFVSWGPSQDSPQFPFVVRQASRYIRFDRLLADAGYDAEHNHRLCREQLGIRSTVIPAINKCSRKWPTAKYRRQMKRRFLRRVYAQRWQVESTFSQHKRRLGTALRARRWPSQQTEIYLRVLTHNLMILNRVA